MVLWTTSSDGADVEAIEVRGGAADLVGIRGVAKGGEESCL